MSTDGSEQQQEIGEITPEQWVEIDKIGLRWKNEQTRKVLFANVVDAVNRLYARASYPPPLVRYADGPVECVVSFTAMTLDLDYPCRGVDPIDIPDPGLAKAGDRMVNDIYAALVKRAKDVTPRYENLEGDARAAAVHGIVADIKSYNMAEHGWAPGAAHYHKLPPASADAKS